MSRFFRSLRRMKQLSKTSDLVFFINGAKHSIPNPSPGVSLSQYLRREADFTSVKIGCEEGGCGACTVLAQRNDGAEIETLSINSCLTSICSLDGMHILTLEGLTSMESELMKSIQQKFMEHGASQCGFCTPGFEIAIYQHLTGKKTKNVEEALSGNLCRCTGYRSILDAVEDITSLESGILEDVSALFPVELLDIPVENKTYVSLGSEWHDLYDLHSLLELKSSHGKDLQLITGGSEIVLQWNYPCRGKGPDELLANTARVSELIGIEESGKFLEVGPSTTLTQIEQYIEGLPSEKNGLYEPIIDMIKLFAGVHIRNVASVGGNVVNASPTSDLNPVWIACDAIFVLKSVNGEREVPAKDFFMGYKTVDIKEDEVLSNIKVPLLQENEYAMSFKQSRRKEDDISIVNSCMRVKFDNDGVVEDCGFAFGGMAPTTVSADPLREYLIGKEMKGQDVLEGCFEELKNALPLEDQAPGGMVEFRRTLSLSFFFKFFLMIQNKVYGEDFDPEIYSVKESAPSVGKWYYPEPDEDCKVVGQPLDSIYTNVQVTGEAKFVDDLPSLKGELHASLVLTTIPKGKVKKIDVKRALEIEGVVGWVDASDIPGHNEYGVALMDEELIVTEDVHCVGQVLGVVVAKDIQTSRKAAKLVEVDYKVAKDPIISINEAIKKDSFFDFKPKIIKGDMEKGWEESTHVFEGELFIGGQDHFQIEPNACLVVHDEGNSFTIHSSTQNPTHVQFETAKALGISENDVVVKAKRLGGGFGGKESRGGIYTAVSAIAAKKFGASVRMVLDRHEDMIQTGQRHPFKCNYRVGTDDEGNLLAVDCDLYSNGGYSSDLSFPVMERALMLFDNCYNIPNMFVRGNVCKTNKPSNTAMRGFGGPQGIFFMEQIIDRVGRELNFSSEELRERHFYKFEGEKTPFGMDLKDCQVINCWDNITSDLDLEVLQQEITDFNINNPHRKRGMSTIPIKFGISFAQTFLNQGSSLVHVYKDGSVLVSHGGVEMGQGLHTKVGQVAAETLGIPMDYIQVLETATDKCANTSPTSASCGSDLNSKAAEAACLEIFENLKPLMEEMGYPEKCSWEELVWSAYFQRVPLSGQGFYATPGLVNMDWETGQGIPFSYFTYGCCYASVEIDSLTGSHEVLDAQVVFDVGRSINPKVDLGQVAGAFIQGYGYLMMEEVVYGDEFHKWVPEGAMQSVGPGFYKIPTASDLPRNMDVRLLNNSNNPFAVLGSKGIGEPPLCLAQSIFFAAKNAILSHREIEMGIIDNEYEIHAPLTVERIRMACADEITSLLVDDDFYPKSSY